MSTNLLSLCLIVTNTWVESWQTNAPNGATQRIEVIHHQRAYHPPAILIEDIEPPKTRILELKTDWQEVNPPRRVTSMSPPPLPVPQGSSSMTNVPLPGTFWIATNTPFGIGTNRYELPPGAYNVLNSPPPLPTNNPPFTATIKR